MGSHASPCPSRRGRHQGTHRDARRQEARLASVLGDQAQQDVFGAHLRCGDGGEQVASMPMRPGLGCSAGAHMCPLAAAATLAAPTSEASSRRASSCASMTDFMLRSVNCRQGCSGRLSVRSASRLPALPACAGCSWGCPAAPHSPAYLLKQGADPQRAPRPPALRLPNALPQSQAAAAQAAASLPRRMDRCACV